MRTQNKNHGFSMIEVLVTITIIAIALLGSAGLQTYALKTNQGGQFRNQAAFFVSDIVERMTANKSFATSANGYATNLATTSDCAAIACTPTTLAAYDVTSWKNSIASAIPGGTGTVTQTTVGNPSTYDIQVNWTDRKTDVTYISSQVAAATESFSIKTTVTIRN